MRRLDISTYVALGGAFEATHPKLTKLITDIRHKSPDLFDTILPPSEKIEVVDDDELFIDGTSTRINTVIGGKIRGHSS